MHPIGDSWTYWLTAIIYFILERLAVSVPLTATGGEGDTGDSEGLFTSAEATVEVEYLKSRTEVRFFFISLTECDIRLQKY